MRSKATVVAIAVVSLGLGGFLGMRISEKLPACPNHLSGEASVVAPVSVEVEAIEAEVAMAPSEDESGRVAESISDAEFEGMNKAMNERFRESTKQRLKVWYDPEFKPAFLAQGTEEIMKTIILFGDHYGIDPVVLRKIAELSSERRLKTNYISMVEEVSDDRSDASYERIRQARDEVDAKLESDLRTLLGGKKYEAYVQYQESEREWKQVDKFSMFADQHGLPLSLAQREQVVAILDEAHGMLTETSASEPLQEILSPEHAELLGRYVREVELIKLAWAKDEELRASMRESE